MDTKKFRTFVLTGIGCLLVLSLLYPLLLSGIVQASSCSKVGGACGAVGALVGMFVKPVGVIIFVIAMIWAVNRRLHLLKINRVWTLAVSCWLLGSATFLVGFGNFWGANFGMGIIGFGLPVLFLFFLVFVVFLAFKNFNSKSSSGRELTWCIAAAAAVHAIALSHLHIILSLAVIPFLGSLVLTVLLPLARSLVSISNVLALGAPIYLMLWVDLAIFAAALSYILLQEGSGGDDAEHVDTAVGFSGAGPRPRSSYNVGMIGSTQQKGFGRRR